jgi:peptide deformylase
LDSFGESEVEEGCLSIPEIRLPIKRPESIRFKYQLPDGSDQTEEFGGLLARAIQHEVDHLKGVFIIDRVSSLMALQYKKKLKEIKMNSNKSRKIRSTKESFVL